MSINAPTSIQLLDAAVAREKLVHEFPSGQEALASLIGQWLHRHSPNAHQDGLTLLARIHVHLKQPDKLLDAASRSEALASEIQRQLRRSQAPTMLSKLDAATWSRHRPDHSPDHQR